MKKRSKNIVSVLGIISLVLGVTSSIPSFLQGNYFGLGAGAFFIILGVILLAVGFGE